MVKNPPTSAGDTGGPGPVLGLGSPPGRRTGQSTPVFLPGESQGAKSLRATVQGAAELDTTECLSMYAMYVRSLCLWLIIVKTSHDQLFLCQFKKDSFFFLKEKCFEREFSQTSALFACFVLFLSFFFGQATWHVGS